MAYHQRTSVIKYVFGGILSPLAWSVIANQEFLSLNRMPWMSDETGRCMAQVSGEICGIAAAIGTGHEKGHAKEFKIAERKTLASIKCCKTACAIFKF